MKKILQILFFVKNDKCHKIITILGLKFKFKKIATSYDISSSTTSINENIDEISNQIKNILLTQSNCIQSNLNEIKMQFTNLNCDFTKNWIIENITNPIFFDIEQKIFNYLEEIKARKFYPIFQNRINKQDLEYNLIETENKYKKKVILVSDISKNFISDRFTVIHIDEISTIKDKDCSIVLLCNKDFNGRKAIKELRKYNLKYISNFNPFPLARYFHIDENAYDTLSEEAKENENWHFCPVDFENIFQALNVCKNLDGDYVEIGTFKGDSASATLNYMKRAGINKKSYFLDTFTGFDYEEALNSEDAQWQNTHGDTSFESVVNRLSQYKNAQVIQSNIIKEDLPSEIQNICVANIDVDMYEAVKAALYKVKDKIIKNGIIICEDYGHTPALIGAQKAVEEFLEENPNNFIPIYLHSGQMFLIKK